MDEEWDFDEDMFLDESGLVERGDCVLVIVDIQDKLLAVMDDKERVLANALKLVRFAKIVGIPVMVTEQEKLGPTVAELAAEIEDFNPITKIEFDAYQVSRFMKTLVGMDRETVVLAGIESHICVTQTALSLLPLFNVHVIADAVASRAAENRQIALDRMRFRGAEISSAEMFIYEILKRADTDEFKQALKLIK